MFTASNIFGQILFGAIGMAAFIYGKKQSGLKAMLMGVALMVYPLFFPATWLLYLIGISLTVGLFIFRDEN